MTAKRALAFVAALTLAPAIAARAQSAEPDPQALIEELNALIERGEEQRSADRPFLRDLRELVARFDRPWQVQLFADDFDDGDYTRSPSWTVTAGEFWVEAGTLKSRVEVAPAPSEPQRNGSEGDTASRVFGEILEEALNGGREEAQQQPGAAVGTPRAVITAPVTITNAFALSTQLSAQAPGGTAQRLQLGPYQADAELGYRLSYLAAEGGGDASLEMLRIYSRGTSVIDSADSVPNLADGRTHTLEWSRDRNGEMVVRLDGQEIMRTVDRGFRDPFDGLVLINEGGEFGLHSVSVRGVEQ
ncbi:hypothetical protein [Thiohalomonas denitrificans]|uniref:Uncharacterized protein n=1 Tax=Thiohalomonas denitrificans TaxID=415747 RepID=A0A1G5QVN9_9GAMM|nr:hypothetical protein [Thiohalomonas denitrificans]SCZ65923.1 hypothetical protein SAMN03097708_02902 [Thiohalomonas denitrificans]